jgi:hypothetical protein
VLATTFIASLEQTSSYLNVERGGLRDSMKKIDDARSRCNPVVNQATIDHPLAHTTGMRTKSK